MMPERCPICNTELLGGEYCPTCKRRVVDEQLAAKVAMLENAIEGWRAENSRLRAMLQRHHRWHLGQTDPDPSIGGQSRAEAYAESAMYDNTEDLLAT